MHTKKIGEMHYNNFYKKLGLRTQFADILSVILDLDITEFDIRLNNSPPWKKYPPNDDIYSWHQDCSNTKVHEIPWFIVWSTGEPTEIRDLITKEVIPFKMHDIIFINNLEVQHRCPTFWIYGRRLLRWADKTILGDDLKI